MEENRLEYSIKIQPQSGAGQDRAAHYSFADSDTFVLTDGAGGIGGGAEAAEFVISYFNKEFPHIPALLMDAMLSVDFEIEKNPKAGETTGIFVSVVNSSLMGVAVGDSEVYQITETGLHNLAESKQRKPLLGSGMCTPAVFEADLSIGRILLCTDGLSKYAPHKKITEKSRIKNLDEATEALIELVKMPSGGFQDDVGIILIDYNLPV